MLLLAAVLVCCVTVLLLGHGAERALSQKWHADGTRESAAAWNARDVERERIAVARRQVAVQEREIALKERESDRAFAEAARLPSPPIEIPADLQARIDAWGTNIDAGEDPFARDAERSTILGLYAAFPDWDVVRSKLVPMPSTEEGQ